MKTKSILIFVLLHLVSVELTSGSDDPVQDRFRVNIGDMVTSVTSENLDFTIRIVKPSTIPKSSDPVKWKVIQRSSGFRELGGIKGQVQSIVYETNIGQLNCETWISERNDLLALRQTFTNKSKKPVKLDYLYPLHVEGNDSFAFGTISDWRILEQFRHKNDLPKTEIPSEGKSATCDPFLVINNNKGNGKNLFIGFQTFYLHLADINISFDEDLELREISADCDFEGVEVPADGSRTSQWVIIAQGNDTNLLIDDYTNRIRTFYGVELPQRNAPSVYCTWYYHADNYNQDIFNRDITQFRKEHLPFDVFLIDECWDINDWGDFEANSSFPDGMKWAAHQINSIGYVAGIWTAPFLVDGESSLAGDHPGWLLKNSNGVRCTFNMNNRDHFILDLTYPGVCEYLEEQFRKMSQEWGYSYYKFDFMRSVFLDSDQEFYDRSATSLEAYRMGLEAIRRGTGNDAYISVCGGHYGASFGIANTQRSGSDVKSQWNEPELPKYRQNILRTWMADLWHVDPDAMMVRRQSTPEPYDKRGLTTGFFTDEEAFTNAVNQFLGGNLITFTEDFARIDADRKMLYKHVIPSVNSASRPLDIFNTPYPEIMITHIEPVCKKLTDWNILTIVNWSDKPESYNIVLDGRITGNSAADRFIVFDFKNQSIIGWFSKGEMLNINDVNGHNSRLFKIVPWDGKSAMFVGTDLNFSCGGIEISDINYSNGSFNGIIDTEWDTPVRLSFVVPVDGGYSLKQVTTGSGQKRFITEF